MNSTEMIDQVLEGTSIREVLDNLLDETSVKVEFKPDTNEQGIPKYKITYKKSDEYKRGNWNFIKNYIKNKKGRYEKLNAYIRVLVWDIDGKPVHDKLGKNFKYDDLKGAKKYAKNLIMNNSANTTHVVGIIKQPYEKPEIFSFGDFVLKE